MTSVSASRGELQPADHICTQGVGVLYYHHGIYVGKAKVSNRYNDKEQHEIDDAVIHFYGPGNKSSAFSSSSSNYRTDQCERCFYLPQVHGVVISCLDCFLKGNSLYLYRNSSSATTYPPDKVIEIAFSLLEKKSDFGPYDLVSNNCEHFANYCKTGKRSSGQVDTAVDTAVGCGITGVLGTVIALIFAEGRKKK